MYIPVVQFAWEGRRIHGVIPDHVINAAHIPGPPGSSRYIKLANLIADAPDIFPAGIILMDCDIAADPDDLAAMREAAQLAPGDVHTALVKNWPASTGRGEWMWSHRGGTLGAPVASQEIADPPAYFATDLTYLPPLLLNLARPLMHAWKWFEGDVQLSEIALRHGIPAHLVRGARPKHLHF